MRAARALGFTFENGFEKLRRLFIAPRLERPHRARESRADIGVSELGFGAEAEHGQRNEEQEVFHGRGASGFRAANGRES